MWRQRKVALRSFAARNLKHFSSTSESRAEAGKMFQISWLNMDNKRLGTLWGKACMSNVVCILSWLYIEKWSRVDIRENYFISSFAAAVAYQRFNPPICASRAHSSLKIKGKDGGIVIFSCHCFDRIKGVCRLLAVNPQDICALSAGVIAESMQLILVRETSKLLLVSVAFDVLGFDNVPENKEVGIANCLVRIWALFGFLTTSSKLGYSRTGP